MNVLMWSVVVKVICESQGHLSLVEVRLPMTSHQTRSGDPSLRFAITLWVGCFFPLWLLSGSTSFPGFEQLCLHEYLYHFMDLNSPQLSLGFSVHCSCLYIIFSHIDCLPVIWENKVSFNLHFPPPVSWLPGLRYGRVLFCNSDSFRIVFLCHVLTSFIRK